MLIIRPLLAAAFVTLMVVSTFGPGFRRVEARFMKSGSPLASLCSAGPLEPTNNPPVAVADSYTVHASLAISPKANDYDPDAGDTISFQSIVTQPQHGVLGSNGGGNFIFTPAYGYVGSDGFTYSICDNHSACSNGQASINIVNQTPVANSDSYPIQ